MGMWMFMYKKPHENPRVNAAEIAYIEQDKLREEDKAVSEKPERKMSFMECLQYPQAWAFAIGKFMTDGVWWFFLFWTPAYISDVYGFSSDSGTAQLLIFVLYAITMLSIYGGKLPTIIINKTGMNPFAARMRAMFIFALFPLLALFARTFVDEERADTARHTSQSGNGSYRTFGEHIAHYGVDVGRPGLVSCSGNTYNDNRIPIGVFS